MVATVIAAIVALALLFRLTSSRPDEVCTLEQLARKDGYLVRTNDGSYFSGRVVEYYAPGRLKSRVAVERGVLEGPAEGWHTNGVLQVTETFHGGVADGVRTKWYASGAKLSESTIVAGKMEGIFRAWHENGQLAEEIAMKNDEPSGEARAWYPSGFLKAALGTNLAGKTEKKHWKDGECRVWPAPGTP